MSHSATKNLVDEIKLRQTKFWHVLENKKQIQVAIEGSFVLSFLFLVGPF